LKSNYLLKQKSYYFVGLLQQVVGGVIGWLTIGIFVFSSITAWDTNTMNYVRTILPWLTLGYFALIVAIGCIVLMFLQHKIVQPSIMNYWNKMFYEQNNPMTEHLKRIETKLDKLSEKVNQ
jgi:hypothetical protein